MVWKSEKPIDRWIGHAIARALLSVEWERDALVAILDEHSPDRAPWVADLVERVLASFGHRGPRPRYEALWRFVLADPIFDEDYRIDAAHSTQLPSWRKEPTLTRVVFEDRPSSPGPAARWSVPELGSVPKLAEVLGVPDSTLEGWADVGGWLGRVPTDARQHYRRWWANVERSPRLIEAPKEQLKKMQRWILREILNFIPPHACAHGFVRGRSIRTHAAEHVGRQVILRCDLRRFFPTIAAPRVRGIFRYVGYPESVAERLTGLCTTITPTDAFVRGGSPADARALYRARHLPQGAPTSPALANLIAYRLDVRLAGLAERFGATYSRYADDLTFSGDHELARRTTRFLDLVGVVVASEGFRLNPAKTRRIGQSARQTVTGVVVNVKPAIARADFDRLKAILHRCELRGPEGENRQGHADFRAHLLGRVAFAEMVDPNRGAKLRERYERIQWPEAPSRNVNLL